MELSLKMFLIACPLVFLGGLVDAIAGGGGIITLPAYLLAGVPIHVSIGSNKLSSSIGTCVSTFRFWKNNYMNKVLIIPTVVAALIGSTLGAFLSLQVREEFLQYMLLIILPFVAFYVFYGKTLKVQEKENSSSVKPHSLKKTLGIATLAAFFIGGYDGFYGPGTGTFLILVFTSLARMDIKTASGNAKIINLTSNIAAMVTFLLNGSILFPLAAAASVFSIAGHYIGSGLVLRNGTKIVRPIILVVILLLFIKVLGS